MIKRNLVTLIIAGVFVGAAAAHAETSPFPVAAENGAFQRHEIGLGMEARSGATAPVYPLAEIQPYIAGNGAAKTSGSPSVGMRSVFPAMAETGPRI